MTEEQPVFQGDEVTCPECGKTINVKQSFLVGDNKELKCSECGKVVGNAQEHLDPSLIRVEERDEE